MSKPEVPLADIIRKHCPELVCKGKNQYIKRGIIAKLIERSEVGTYYILQGEYGGISYHGAKNLVAYTEGKLTLEMLEPYISR